MRVAFRVDASLDIGAGHVMRCITLAHALREEGARCSFICRPHPGNLIDLLGQNGFEVAVLENISGQKPLNGESYAAWLGCSWEKDAEETAQMLVSQGMPDWLVVDHYAIDIRWEARVQSYCGKLLIIDDLANRPHSGDMLLDQTFGRTAASYTGLTGPACELRCGVQHVLLRPEFDEWRMQSLKRRELGRIDHILINLGGIDKDNITRRVLLALDHASLPPCTRVLVVLGESSPWIADIRKLAGSLSFPAEVLSGVHNMAELLAGCDLAIGAAGSSSWERCYLGVPSLMVVLADNQREIAAALAREKAAKLLTPGSELTEHLAAELRALRANPDDLRQMSCAAAALVRGSGARALAHSMARLGA